MTKEEDKPDTIAFNRVFLGCEWFQVYDLVEDAFAQLRFHEQELADPDAELRAYPLQRSINDFFCMQASGGKWWMVKSSRVATSPPNLL